MATLSEALAVALEHHRAGRVTEAEQIYRQILAVEPDEPNTLNLLGVIAHDSGRHDLALQYLQRAVAVDGTEAIFQNNLGNVLKALGKPDEAVACYRRALELNPRHVRAHYNLAIALKEQEKWDEAIACCQRVLELLPDDAEAHNHLGNTLKAAGRPEEAAAAYRRALQHDPRHVEAHHNLGCVLRDEGNAAEAVACYRRVLQLEPELIEAHCNLGAALQDLGQLDEAIACYRQALQIRPEDVPTLSHLGNALLCRGKTEEAIACHQRALLLKYDDAVAHCNLSLALKDQGRLDEAIVCCRKALQLDPGLRQAHANWIYMTYFSPDYDARAIGEEHRRWGRRFADPLAKHIVPHPNDRSPDRRLRVGYVSPDFRLHPVGRFLAPLLESHDHERFEILAYASVRRPDALTAGFRRHVDGWRNVLSLSDEKLAEAIRADQVDILVDLTMHMANNRLLTFARKPAPVQVTYLAYCGTTGLAAIDYRLTDPYLDPPDQDAAIYTEQSVHLPETYWCFRPAIETPPPDAPPASRAGHVTFGCLNNFCKVSAPALAAWSRILQAMPTARLLLHAHGGPHRDRVWEFFHREGVARERVEFLDFLPMREFYRVHERIDVALDPFPYCGGTTSCDALWMGVPVVSLAGQTAVGRGGLSILTNLGLTDLVASDGQQYVRIAVELAGDAARLGELRRTLRRRMQDSPLMDAPRFARNVEAAYHEMWRRWCLRCHPGKKD
jgi:predicted O-linked N-acetylglucosamine transferase (SPINDLY family)